MSERSEPHTETDMDGTLERGEQSRPSEIYVEVGPGLDPSAVNGTRKFDGDKAYYGIDAGMGWYNAKDGRLYGAAVQEELPRIQEQVQRDRPDEHIQFIHGEGHHLPFKDSSVHEVYMANAMAAISEDEIVEIFREAARVLRPGGEFVVKVSRDSGLYNIDFTRPRLQWTGFEVNEVVTAKEQPERFAELEQLYGTSRDVELPQGYFCIATHRKEAEL